MIFILPSIIKILQYIDPNQVLIDLENAIMLCYEPFPIDEDYNPRLHFCHRHIVSVWLELECGFWSRKLKQMNMATKLNYLK